MVVQWLGLRAFTAVGLEFDPWLGNEDSTTIQCGQKKKKLKSKKLTIDPKKHVAERPVCVYMYVCCAALC